MKYLSKMYTDSREDALKNFFHLIWYTSAGLSQRPWSTLPWATPEIILTREKNDSQENPRHYHRRDPQARYMKNAQPCFPACCAACFPRPIRDSIVAHIRRQLLRSCHRWLHDCHTFCFLGTFYCLVRKVFSKNDKADSLISGMPVARDGFYMPCCSVPLPNFL